MSARVSKKNNNNNNKKVHISHLLKGWCYWENENIQWRVSISIYLIRLCGIGKNFQTLAQFILEGLMFYIFNQYAFS